jgi:hypothetical protein
MHEINLKISEQHKELIESTFSVSIEKYLSNEVEKALKRCKSIDSMKHDYILKEFISAKCEFCPNNIITLSVLYSHYEEWNRETLEPLRGKVQFSKYLKTLHNVVVKRGGANVVKVYGIKLEDDWEFDL